MGWLMLLAFSVVVSNAVFTMREDSTSWGRYSRTANAKGNLFDQVEQCGWRPAQLPRSRLID